jgi:hypothetical protein
MESVSYLLCSQKPITEPVDSNPNQHPNSLRSVLIISFHLCVSHQNLSSTSHVFLISTYDFFMPHPHQYYLISVTVLSKVGRSRWQPGLERRTWSLSYWGRGFKSSSGHGCLSVCYCVVLSCVGRGFCNGLILVQRSPTACLRITKLQMRKPRPDMGCRAIEKKLSQHFMKLLDMKFSPLHSPQVLKNSQLCNFCICQIGNDFILL